MAKDRMVAGCIWLSYKKCNNINLSQIFGSMKKGRFLKYNAFEIK